MNSGREHVFHRLGLFLLNKNHGQLHDITHQNSWSDAACLDGDHFIDGRIGKQPTKLFGYFHHEIGIHLMVDKTIYFKNSSRKALSVLEDAGF